MLETDVAATLEEILLSNMSINSSVSRFASKFLPSTHFKGAVLQSIMLEILVFIQQLLLISNLQAQEKNAQKTSSVKALVPSLVSG